MPFKKTWMFYTNFIGKKDESQEATVEGDTFVIRFETWKRLNMNKFIAINMNKFIAISCKGSSGHWLFLLRLGSGLLFLWST